MKIRPESINLLENTALFANLPSCMDLSDFIWNWLSRDVKPLPTSYTTPKSNENGYTRQLSHMKNTNENQDQIQMPNKEKLDSTTKSNARWKLFMIPHQSGILLFVYLQLAVLFYQLTKNKGLHSFALLAHSSKLCYVFKRPRVN